MAINAYCGVMGSGKSYEVVSGPLLDAVGAGRRVVTNVDGVNEDAIHCYLQERRGVSRDRLGAIVHVRTEDILQDGFFPVEVEQSGGATVTPGFVKPGDLLVVDEAWKLWASDKKVSREHMSFFRMHRHFVHDETGVACDVVLMIQSIADLHRSIKAVIELSFRMVKLKSVGLSNGYRVEMYETYKQTKATRTGTFIRRYKVEIFPLYKSYAGQAGTESVVDRRQNILARKSLWLFALALLFVSGFGAWGAWRFIHPHAEVIVKAKSGMPAPASAVPAVANTPVALRNSDTWRLIGTYVADGLAWVVIADSANHLRVESPAEFKGRGVAMVGIVEGQRVAMWSGPKDDSLPLSGSGPKAAK